jgi:hypothetical protein
VGAVGDGGAVGQAVQIGTGRPPLPLVDLPEPEEVFKVPRIGVKEAITVVIGPSLIALGLSIGSGEWLLGPLAVAQYGFVGIGWVILLSALLQTFYNVEVTRYIMATGEVPVLGWARVPPGWWLWVPLALLMIYFASIWGGWAAGAGEGLYVLLTGSLVDQPSERTTARWLAVLLMAIVFLLVLFGRKIARTLELVNWVVVGFILITLLIVNLLVVPFETWWTALRGLLTPALPPSGVDATLLGGLAGYTALASGLNWYNMNYYRDHGYGMGSRVGFTPTRRREAGGSAGQWSDLPGYPGERASLEALVPAFAAGPVGRFLGGALIGMYLTTLLVYHLANLPGIEKPTRATMPTFAADILSREYGTLLYYWALIVGFFILFSTQLGIFESLVRNMSDALYGLSPAFRRAIAGDPRRFYYPFMIVLLLVISFLIFQALPTELILISANMANLGALVFPFLLMYLNRRLPRPARLRWWSYLLLVGNTIFFGFFFVNFLWTQLTGGPLVKF